MTEAAEPGSVDECVALVDGDRGPCLVHVTGTGWTPPGSAVGLRMALLVVVTGTTLDRGRGGKGLEEGHEQSTKK